MKKKWKLAIGGLIVLIAFGFLGYKGFIASASYYYKVDEFLSQKSTLAGC